MRRIRTMASEAFVGKNRPDVAIEFDALLCGAHHRQKGQEGTKENSAMHAGWYRIEHIKVQAHFSISDSI